MSTAEWIQLIAALVPAVAIVAGVRAMARTAEKVNEKQDTRLDRLVEVSERHENRLTRLETIYELEHQ